MPFRSYPAPHLVGSLVLVAMLWGCRTVLLTDLETPRPLPVGACLAVGFLGGVDRWNDSDKGVRRLALDLRNPVRAVFAETFENRRTFVALSFLEDALDANHDGNIDVAESRRARLVVYGQSLGGWAAVEFARMLADRGIPVEFLLQIDSVGFRDGDLPDNVRYAANFYQDDGWVIAGEHPIRASNPERTRILGNWKFSYDQPPGSTIEIGDLPWWKKAFRLAHTRMDRDPRVWAAAARLVQEACGRERSADPARDRFRS